MTNENDKVTQEEVDDAMEMLGAGYVPTLILEKPRIVTERRRGKFIEVERPAFVKIYTDFKTEMRDIDEIALKVWLYIALSVNRKTGTANPGLRTIAEDCSLAVNTVRSAIDRLENSYNLLTVQRGDRKYNIYEPVDYVSANKESVSSGDTDENETVSAKRKTVSSRMILNQRNQNKEAPQKARRAPRSKTGEPFTYEWPAAIRDYGESFEILPRLIDPNADRWQPISKGDYVLWMNGAHAGQVKGFIHFKQAGITVLEMQEAYVEMRRQKLTVKNPNSLFTYAFERHQKNNRNTRGGDDLKKLQAERRAEFENSKSLEA